MSLQMFIGYDLLPQEVINLRRKVFKIQLVNISMRHHGIAKENIKPLFYENKYSIIYQNLNINSPLVVMDIKLRIIFIKRIMCTEAITSKHSID